MIADISQSTEHVSESSEVMSGKAPEPTASRGRGVRLGMAAAERFGLLVLLIIMAVIFSIQLPDTFATAANWRAIAVSQAVLAVAAMALMLPLVAGRFDISVGANIGITSIACAAAMSKHSYPLIAAIAVALAIGLAIGVVNGLLVAYLGVNSIIATLGVGIILGGLVQAYTEGVPISSGLSPSLTGLSADLWLGIPVLFIIMLAIGGLTAVVLNQTTFGRYMVATGANEVAARLNGMPVRRILLGSFVVGGLLAGAAGVLQVAAQGNGNPQVGGIQFILPALAAVFLGATTLRPGTYNVAGTILALFFIGVAVSGLAILGAQPWVTDVFNGAAVVVAVTLSAQFRRRRTGAAELGT
jgi:ribose transport system permease protein